MRWLPPPSRNTANGSIQTGARPLGIAPCRSRCTASSRPLRSWIIRRRFGIDLRDGFDLHYFPLIRFVRFSTASGGSFYRHHFALPLRASPLCGAFTVIVSRQGAASVAVVPIDLIAPAIEGDTLPIDPLAHELPAVCHVVHRRVRIRVTVAELFADSSDGRVAASKCANAEHSIRRGCINRDCHCSITFRSEGK